MNKFFEVISTDGIDPELLKPIFVGDVELSDYTDPVVEEKKKYKKDTPIYVLDLETDPFLRGRVPVPFTGGLYDGKKFSYSWGENCIDKLYGKLSELPPGIVYIHNGGKFDLFYFIQFLRGRMLVINGRIVKAKGDNKHEFRDSYAIMPIPLAAYKKDDIDYSKMEADVRELHKEEILHYLKKDCEYLYELVMAFIDRFGIQITIGSTSMKQFCDVHKYKKLTKRQDFEIRGGDVVDAAGVFVREEPGFYFGGRVQCFETGNLKGNFKIYDVNSMYPFAMSNYLHPTGECTSVTKEITEETCFLEVEGINNGAFATRGKNGLDFTRESGRYQVSIHEWQAAIDYGMFVPTRIIRCLNFECRDTFGKFVDKFYNLRLEAKVTGYTFGFILYKLVLNAAYGKLAANPDDYQDYEISELDLACHIEGCKHEKCWRVEKIVHGKYGVFYRSSTRLPNYFNVAAGASITGAARALLMEAIHKAKRPVYCDTDSLICESLEGVKLGDEELGAWKCEGTGDRVSIAGKKMYAVWNGGEIIKQANKGVLLTADEIRQICDGESITCYKDAPTFSLSKAPYFQSRTIKMTGDNLTVA